MTFIDDHTRLCWIYLMHDKSEVENLFKSFYNMIENQFHVKLIFFDLTIELSISIGVWEVF